MLKEFIACKDALRRFLFFKETVLSDWTNEEFNIIAGIIGITIDKDDDLSKNYSIIRSELQKRAE